MSARPWWAISSISPRKQLRADANTVALRRATAPHVFGAQHRAPRSGFGIADRAGGSRLEPETRKLEGLIVRGLIGGRVGDPVPLRLALA